MNLLVEIENDESGEVVRDYRDDPYLAPTVPKFVNELREDYEDLRRHMVETGERGCDYCVTEMARLFWESTILRGVGADVFAPLEAVVRRVDVG